MYSRREHVRRIHTQDVIQYVFVLWSGSLCCVVCSGSDGLVKVWTIKSNECVATLDKHTEKVRANLCDRMV